MNLNRIRQTWKNSRGRIPGTAKKTIWRLVSCVHLETAFFPNDRWCLFLVIGMSLQLLTWKEKLFLSFQFYFYEMRLFSEFQLLVGINSCLIKNQIDHHPLLMLLVFFYAWERESDLKYLLIFSCGVFQKDNHCEVVSYQNLEILFKNLPISLVFYQKFGLPWVLNYKKKNAI